MVVKKYLILKISQVLKNYYVIIKYSKFLQYCRGSNISISKLYHGKKIYQRKNSTYLIVLLTKKYSPKTKSIHMIQACRKYCPAPGKGPSAALLSVERYRQTENKNEHFVSTTNLIDTAHHTYLSL